MVLALAQSGKKKEKGREAAGRNAQAGR